MISELSVFPFKITVGKAINGYLNAGVIIIQKLFLERSHFMDILVLIVKILFQLSALMIGLFLIKFSFDWSKNESFIGRIFVFGLGSSLSVACFLMFLTILYVP